MIIKSFRLFESLKGLTDDLIQHGELQDIMKELHPVRYDNIGDKLQKIINRFQSDVDYDTPKEWFEDKDYKSFMDYFTRKLSSDKIDEINSQSLELAIPCECKIESIGDFSDTTSILRLKKDTEDIVQDLKKLGLRNIEDLRFINMKLWKCYYHRIHSPIDGKIEKIQYISKGENFFGNNNLWIVTFNSNRGLIYMLLVGELSIQDFDFEISEGDSVKMFQEIGRFDWASQVVLIYNPSQFNNELNVIDRQKYFVGDSIF